MKNTVLLGIMIIVTGCSSSNDKEISASGTIEATEVTVSAKVGGEVIRLLVDEGSSVKTGDTLAVIDPTDYLIQLKEAEANVAAMEAQYKLTLRGAREEDILQAEANFKNAESDLKRMEELWASKSITQKQLDDARTRFTVAQQAWEKMKRWSRPEEIITTRARRDQARAQLESIKKKIQDCAITAPIGGTVTQKAVEQGELVVPNAPLFRISRLEKLNLMIYVSEQELGRVKLGQQAKVQIDTYKEKTFPGRVVYISPIAEFTPKNIQTKEDRTKLVFGVKLEVDNQEGILKAGMPADAYLQ